MKPEQLAGRFQREGLEGAAMLRRLAPPMVTAIKAEAPVKSDRLRKGVRSRVTNDSISITSNVPHLRYVVEGTRPHIIRPKAKKALRFKSSSGAIVYAKQVRHPGTKPNDFLTRGMEASMPTVERLLQEMGDDLFRRIAE